MDYQSEIRSFLVSRRAQLSPEQAGVPFHSGARRVPGLRREEVAQLAGVSVDYYTRLERGKTKGASTEVLEAIAEALQLDDAEREHLMHLAQASRPKRRASANPGRKSVRPAIQMVLDSVTGPAYVQNGRMDLLGANQLARAVYSQMLEDTTGQANFARFNFLDPRARDFHYNWEQTARNSVALLHAAAARDPQDQDLINLIGQLSTQSTDFRTLWASHNVLRYRSGIKRYHHPLVGDLSFGFEGFEIATDPGQLLTVLTVEPGSPSAAALNLLASWTAPARGAVAAPSQPVAE
ncbi:helix-turn-helix transcriptional regulator [Arthrobacter oryzae]|uniref:helix-turn-helix transcriptional regulator n=1 Tax=Arthrobacter oryzae TaxID=409290 RepID=UPI00273C1F48|nr:helix-turn-helix transcriptional regulator [Arthrobacter oryzae]WLQ07574.1 helix-turn-helix transcriptional regulator [Arthrobacter oryzae]